MAECLRTHFVESKKRKIWISVLIDNLQNKSMINLEADEIQKIIMDLSKIVGHHIKVFVVGPTSTLVSFHHIDKMPLQRLKELIQIHFSQKQ